MAKTIVSNEETASLGDTAPGLLIGTPRYMSPEQLRGEAPSESWDLWALAVVAYEMLAGAYPFAGVVSADWHQAMRSSRVIPLRVHFPEASEGWDAFFQRALGAQRAQRPASAAQFLADFQDAVR